VAASLAAILSPTAQSQSEKQAVPKRFNELRLAGLRPGVDTLKQARSSYKRLEAQPNENGTFVLHNPCYKSDLFLETDATERIKTLRLADNGSMVVVDCFPKGSRQPPILVTGRGLSVFDYASKVIALYGEPTSRSPSTRNGQPLELLYYAFDWAGPDVPQVMEVVCTVPKDGTRGRVVEITLAAGSL